MASTPDYSIGFTREEVEEILAAQKAELKRTLAAWSESGSSVQKRRIDEIHAIIAACQAALRKLAPESYGRPKRLRDPRTGRINPRNLKQAYPVDASALRALKRDLLKRVGELAAGWNAGAQKLGVKLPAWVARHGSARS